jgi:hypothetical protein
MYEVTDDMPPHARVVIREPAKGWSRGFYERHIAQYVTDRGSPPRTVTLHPETMAALGFSTTWVNASPAGISEGPLLVPSSDYARDTITLYE